jgi:prepilin-type processing-associated H-X9-DG protein
LGLQNYHDARKTFPYAYVIAGSGTYSDVTAYQGPNWVCALLPFTEGTGVMSLYDKNGFFVDTATNISFRSSTLPFLICPTDSNTSKLYNGSNMAGTSNGLAATTGSWGRTNYGANMSATQYNGAGAIGTTGTAYMFNYPQRTGVMMPNASIPLRMVTDGSSKTVLVAEMRVDIGPSANRGTWASTGGSALCAHAAFYWTATNGFTASGSQDDNGPNNGGTNADDSATCGNAQSFAGSASALITLGMGCYNSAGGTAQLGPKSMHSGGLQYVMCDGSVHWMDDTIPIGSGTSTATIVMGPYEMLFLSQDGGDLPQDVYNN